MPIPLILHSHHGGPTVTYQPVGPWLVPWRIESLEAEYAALRSGVGLLDRSTDALIEVRGADRAGFLHALLTNDLLRLSPGHGCRAALLDSSAKLIAELLVLADEEALWLLCDLLRAEIVLATLERCHFSEQVELIHHERRRAVLALQGPMTFPLLATLCGGPLSLPSVGDHALARVGDCEVRLIHQMLTDEPGVLLVVEAEAAREMWDRLRRSGASMGVRPVGWEALNVARIEAGIPWFGVDMDATHLLPETGLDALLVSETKGCYLGQEIIARLSTYGSVSKRLMGLRLAAEAVPQAGDAILCAEEPVGSITSACHSLAVQRPIALGYVKRGAYDPGTAVVVLHGSERLPATVVERPFLAP